jgi:hypothetical protein
MPRRNDKLYDRWSIVHLSSGIVFGWLMAPFIALVILVLYEPFENFVLSPFFDKFGIFFGHETIRNSLSDIVFDTVGVVIGSIILAKLISPPFQLFT